MALTGLEIFKLLPKTNCKDCGFPTCLAFAMKLAAKQANVDACVHLSDEAKCQLQESFEPTIKLVEIGVGEYKFTTGNETVMFRHEETFYHETGIAVTVNDDDSDIENRINKINALRFERVGTELSINLIAVKNVSNDKDLFAKAVKECSEKSDFPLILISENKDAINEALKHCVENKPLICGANADNYEAFAKISSDNNCSLTVTGNSIEEIAELTRKIKELGCDNLVVGLNSKSVSDNIDFMTSVRRAGLKKKFRSLGYMPIVFTSSDNKYQAASEASTYVMRYAGIVITDLIAPEFILPILTCRQNIFTDPRKPVQVEAKVYEVGTPDENSPFIVTTNFSLTYYTVEGEVESSRVPCRILTVDTEGTSVLTAWAADKFNPETITAAIKKSGIEDMINHRNVIIPGQVAVISAGLKEESGWEVLVGPKEASGLPVYLKKL